jgi:hypothetical protein
MDQFWIQVLKLLGSLQITYFRLRYIQRNYVTRYPPSEPPWVLLSDLPPSDSGAAVSCDLELVSRGAGQLTSHKNMFRFTGLRIYTDFRWKSKFLPKS